MVDRLVQSRMEPMATKNAALEAQVNQLKSQMATQDDEIHLLKNRISQLESSPPAKSASNEVSEKNPPESSINKAEKMMSRASSSPPSSCQDLWGFGYFDGMDGIYLVKDQATTKIQAVFCQFSSAGESKD